jgi:putative flippase GtrA
VKTSLQALTNNPVAAQFTRFAVVGCINVAVSFFVFYTCYKIWPIATILLNALGDIGVFISTALANIGIGAVDATFANIAGYTAGIVNSFFLNKIWTFQVKGNVARQMHRFLLLNLLGLGLSTIIIFVAVDLLDGPYLFTWFMTIGIVMMLNFIGQRHWAFSDRATVRAEN